MIDFEVFVVDNYIDNMSNERASDFMSKIWKFKKDMYSSAHGELHDAIDIDDYHCTHIAFVSKETQKIIMAFKYFDYDFSVSRGIDFPLVKHASKYSKEFCEKIENYLRGINDEGKKISYSGGWCIDKEILSPKARVSLIKAYICIHYLEQVKNKFDFITGIGVQEVGTINFFNKNFNTKPIVNEIVDISGYGDLNCCFLACTIKQLAIKGEEDIDKYLSVWDSRVKIC